VLLQVLYPYLRKKNIEPTMLQKIALGFLFALGAMVYEGIVEIMRQKYAPTPGKWGDASAESTSIEYLKILVLTVRTVWMNRQYFSLQEYRQLQS
jgi:hypothetical protein